MRALFKNLSKWLRPLVLASRARETVLLTLVASTAITAVLSHFDFYTIEAALYDLRVRHGYEPKPSPEIVLVKIDDATLGAFQEISPLSLRAHANFLESLESYEPKAVGYLANLSRAAQLENGAAKINAANRIIDATGRLKARAVPVVVGTPFDVTGEVVPPYPLSTLPHGLALIHKDGNVFAGDKVTRRALTSLYDRPVFHLLLASEAGLVPSSFIPRGSFEIPEIEASYFYFRYHSNPVTQKYKHGEAPSYTTVAFEDIVRKKIAPETLRGKILLVGTETREDSTDYAFTPYSSDPFSTPKLAIHATILDSVLRNDGLHRFPQSVAWITTFTVSATVIAWVLNSTPLVGVLASVSMVAILWLVSLLLFNGWNGSHGFWLETAHPSLGILISYYLAVPYRLIREYRKRWEYQRKNELLLQVEELKTNFLSLVTHDLKTPVARIHGLAEVLMMKASMRLTERDQETIRHIISSTDELNRFISSILELAKVESSTLMLRLESKDINQLIERCAETFKAPARAKGCKIELDLEPLFPIRIDPLLMQKVLHNLVDNAIKYSPTGSTIRLETRDLGEWIEIHVRDQGVGLSKTELEHVFTKFFRAKNDATARVGGSGLGLYLTKYFVEAHQGEVRVQSATGGGSTFTIRLRTD
ncbi:CHASE2 domain-containing protein, partial [bacterium]|nr:CHASE2 domain-containing protein [bacterium]